VAEIAPRITADAAVHFGRPVDQVVVKIAGGMTVEEVASEYGITRDNVIAELSNAARDFADEQVRAIMSRFLVD
jgi:uncharacterized protein (DUF433 family)